MTEPTPERPLVTFALFAYNQEQYIREAVEGAFSQTYEPLEIILSDDCSSDRTFEIMQEMAGAYEGPHEVRVVKREKNLGIAFHVNAIFEEAAGKYIVLAAGDDVSCSHRTRVSVDNLEKHNGLLFYSWVTPVGGDLRFTFEDLSLSRPEATKKHAISSRLYIGATGVIAKRLFEKYGPLPSTDLYEDQVFGFRASLENGIRFSKERLVNYRLSGVSRGSRHPTQSVDGYIDRRRRGIAHKTNLLKARRTDLHKSNHANSVEILGKIDLELDKLLSTARALYSPSQEIRRGGLVIGTIEALKLLKAHIRMFFSNFGGECGSGSSRLQRKSK